MKTRRSLWVFFSSILFAFAVLLASAHELRAATFTVDDSGDTDHGYAAATCNSPCTLRDAIDAVNSGAGSGDLIQFNISGAGVHTIQPASVLPDITKPVTINGYSQPGSSANTLAQGINAVLLIELDGTNAGINNSGLTLSPGASGSTVKGLVINQFNGNGIFLNGVANNVIEGNFIGTDPTGTLDRGNFQTGVVALDADNNQIGGTTPPSRNLISNGSFGVQTAGLSGTGNLIQGNFIGTDITGTAPLGNGVGVLIFTSNNTIGGLNSGSGNLIAFNTFTGVVISGNNPAATGNAILGNSIFSNGGLGIDLGVPPNEDTITPNDPGDVDTGANNLQNFPDLSSAISANGSITIQGTLDSTASSNFRIEFFANNACDPTGNGEGQTFLGALPATTDGSGNLNFNASFPAAGGLFITATATDPNNNTSEFSTCLQATILVENCTNGIDDDGDNLVDCNDPDCASAANCTPSEISGSGCSLGRGSEVARVSIFLLLGSLLLAWLVAKQSWKWSNRR
jgi:hypothetical protein